MAKAFVRSLISVNVTAMMERVTGAKRAANAPPAPRAMIRISGFGASPPIAEAEANPMSPMKSDRFRPKKSPMRPPRSSRPPKVNA